MSSHFQYLHPFPFAAVIKLWEQKKLTEGPGLFFFLMAPEGQGPSWCGRQSTKQKDGDKSRKLASHSFIHTQERERGQEEGPVYKTSPTTHPACPPFNIALGLNWFMTIPISSPTNHGTTLRYMSLWGVLYSTTKLADLLHLFYFK